MHAARERKWRDGESDGREVLRERERKRGVEGGRETLTIFLYHSVYWASFGLGMVLGGGPYEITVSVN